MDSDLGAKICAAKMTYAWRIMAILPLGLWLALVVFILVVLKEPLHGGDGVTMGIATIALILIPAFIWYWHPKIQVRLYEKGVVHQGLFKRTELAWEDLLFVRYRAVRQRFHGVNVGTNYYVTLVGRKMETIKLTNNLQGGVKLINYVLNRILEAQIPKFTTLINQGHEIPFGKIFLGSGGLRVKARVARWQDIAGISLASGQVKVRLKNKWFSFYRKQFSSMPNGHAFIHLCQQRLGVK